MYKTTGEKKERRVPTNTDTEFSATFSKESMLLAWSNAKDKASELTPANWLDEYNRFEAKVPSVGVPIEARWYMIMTKCKDSAVKFCKITMHRGVSWYSYLDMSSKAPKESYRMFKQIAQDLNIGRPGARSSGISPLTVCSVLAPLMKTFADLDVDFKSNRLNWGSIAFMTNRIPLLPGMLAWLCFSDKSFEADLPYRVVYGYHQLCSQQDYIADARKVAGAPLISDDDRLPIVAKSLANWNYSFNGYNFACRKAGKLLLGMSGVGKLGESKETMNKLTEGLTKELAKAVVTKVADPDMLVLVIKEGFGLDVKREDIELAMKSFVFTRHVKVAPTTTTTP